MSLRILNGIIFWSNLPEGDVGHIGGPVDRLFGRWGGSRNCCSCLRWRTREECLLQQSSVSTARCWWQGLNSAMSMQGKHCVSEPYPSFVFQTITKQRQRPSKFYKPERDFTAWMDKASPGLQLILLFLKCLLQSCLSSATLLRKI